MREINVNCWKPLRFGERAKKVLFKHNEETNTDGYGEGWGRWAEGFMEIGKHSEIIITVHEIVINTRTGKQLPDPNLNNCFQIEYDD